MHYFLHYSSVYKKELLSIFESNVPDYFAPHEKDYFDTYVDEHPNEYSVLFLNSKIIGAGGIALNKDDTVSLVWGMIGKDYHKQGYGEALLKFRLIKAKENYPGKIIVSNTSQFTEGFFAKYGFKTVYTKDNYWAAGLHLRKMTLHI
jgi:N-acetylglutamate synthase-like GNAT family acetyltransferase